MLAAISLGVEAADEDVVRTALGRADWVLRGGARRRFESALIDATLATPAAGSDRDGVRHRLRAAALIVSDVNVDLADAARVAAEYAALPPLRPWHLPVFTIAAASSALALALLLLVATVQIVTAAGPPGAFERPTPPPAVGVFRDGGVPQHDAAIERALAVDLPQVFAAATAAERDATLAALRDHAAFARTDELASSWHDLIGCLERWLRYDADASANRKTSRELRARAAVVSDQLAALELGYYVEAVLAKPRAPGLYGYRIEHVGFVRGGDERTRVFGVRVLGERDERAGMLGLSSVELDDPIVLLDQVDAKVEADVLPVAYGAVFPVGDASWANTARGRDMAIVAGRAIRRELLTALGSDIDSFDRAGARAKHLVAASVRRHEAQHAFDQARRLRHPAVLGRLVGDAADSPFGLRTRYELSAYLGQIASDTWTPQLVMWSLARHAFRRSPSRVEESYAAAIAIEAIARELGIPSRAPVIERGVVDRERLANLLFPLANRSTTELRSAAANAWRELFGAKLVRLVDDSPRGP